MAQYYDQHLHFFFRMPHLLIASQITRQTSQSLPLVQSGSLVLSTLATRTLTLSHPTTLLTP